MAFLHAGEEVIFIANDWHTALLPCYLKAIYQPKGIYKSAKVGDQFICFETNKYSSQLRVLKNQLFCQSCWQVAFCIHNIAYQGRFAFADFALLNLPDEFKSSFDFIDG